jgi:hypothetical protein
MALTRTKKTAEPKAETAPKSNTTQSRHFGRKASGISGLPENNTVQAYHRLSIDGARALPTREVEMVTCKVYRWNKGKLHVARTVTRPKTLVSGFKGQLGMPKSREGDFTLLDELFDYDVKSDGYQASEAVLRTLLEAWVAQHGQRLSGNDRLYLARAFTYVMAARSGVDIATEAGVA